jgi:hypothetical protein
MRREVFSAAADVNDPKRPPLTLTSYLARRLFGRAPETRGNETSCARAHDVFAVDALSERPAALYSPETAPIVRRAT